MKTIDCLTLDTLIENHEPLDLIDIRSKKEFAEMHIPGARSLPLAELTEAHIFRPRPLTNEHVYVVSGSASLVAGILRACSGVDAVVVEGGMKAWTAQGFPVLRHGFSLKLPRLDRSRLLKMSACLLALGMVVALILNEVLIAILLLSNAAILLLQARFLEPRPIERSPAWQTLTSAPAES
jgi:rhodanese-related sulfurtransferase